MKFKKLAVVLTIILLAAVGLVALLSNDFAAASERSQPLDIDVPASESTEGTSEVVPPEEILATLELRMK